MNDNFGKDGSVRSRTISVQESLALPTDAAVPTRYVVGDCATSRLKALGTSGLSDCDLLSILLAERISGERARAVSKYLLKEAGSLKGIAAWKEADLLSIPGVSTKSAGRILAAIELARRIPLSESPRECFSRADAVFAHFSPLVLGLDVEKVFVCSLNRKNYLIKREEVSSGSSTNALVSCRDVFRSALKAGATCIVLVHNHPSGDPASSSADIQITRAVRDASKAVDIELLDHVIIGDKARDPLGIGYFSFRSAGILR